MNQNVLSVWRYTSTSERPSLVIPDGCRDFILKQHKDIPSRCYISPILDQPESISALAGTTITGFRFKAGVQIDIKKLLSSIKIASSEPNEIFNRLDDFTLLDSRVEEALFCLSSKVNSVAQAANDLGVSQRTLQRLLISKTNRPPVYWLLLARAKQAARCINESSLLAEVADTFGYSDQAHMSREFKRWFKTSPSLISNSKDIVVQLNAPSYA